MTDEYKKVQVPITEEIKHLRWQFEQTEQRAERAEQAYKDLESSFVSASLTNDASWRIKLTKWKQIAVTLASELEEAEQKLWDDKKWIESYCDDAECWKEQAEEARKSWERTTLQRQEVLDQLYELFEAVRPHAHISKHIYRECEDAEKLLEKYEKVARAALGGEGDSDGNA